jgi:hypothetical protein
MVKIWFPSFIEYFDVECNGYLNSLKLRHMYTKANVSFTFVYGSAIKPFYEIEAKFYILWP